MTLEWLDTHCNFWARRGAGLARMVRPPAECTDDPFLLWVFELGVREGQYLRDRANIARWGAVAA